MRDYGFLSAVDEKAAYLDALADDIWAHPELAFSETRSAEALIRALKDDQQMIVFIDNCQRLIHEYYSWFIWNRAFPMCRRARCRLR